MANAESVEMTVEPEALGVRLDTYVASKMSRYSRTAIRTAITDGGISVDSHRRKPSYKLKGGEKIVATIQQTVAAGPKPEEIPLEILFEDAFVAVINKPSGMVVHPAKGHWAGTLTGALSYHFQHLSQVGGAHRPGIVHRLDRDTSGVIIVAKTDQAHVGLSRQFENRDVEKQYYAICRGSLDRDRDWIRKPVGVHPYQREKMAIRSGHETSREAETFFEVERRWKGYVSVKAFPKTGRTHQIRVHLAHVGCPVLCDPLYSGQRRLTAADCSSKRSASDEVVLLDRLALHAHRLTLTHPISGAALEFEAEIPAPLKQVTQHFKEL